ncbi:hypothetical protein [Roseofilum casamattae]|uniref:Uncharacterized protein n=1 Tax=Roseofilum casamattae BLCC-M143 TaxID=3022442 RepID=A0ABT7BSG7_9CYAN|nr:hypothetical protein [Roseofilum casamattae]MDJ1182126.1 hypothetical protein [Roseofilum casamattae BLCC-M143]
MSLTVNGAIARQDIGPGVWSLVTPEGTTYELKDAPPDLKQAGLQVQVEGNLREDIMTMAAIGPVLEVLSFESLD